MADTKKETKKVYEGIVNVKKFTVGSKKPKIYVKGDVFKTSSLKAYESMLKSGRIIKKTK